MFDGLLAGISNEDHDVTENTARPLLNELCRAIYHMGSQFHLSKSQIRRLSEREQDFYEDQQVTKPFPKILRQFKVIVPAAGYLDITYCPIPGITR